MSRLRTQRGSVRRSFTRAYNELKEEIEKNEDKPRIAALWKRLEDRFQQLEKLDEEIMQELRGQDITQEDMDEEYDTIQEYRDKWNDLPPLDGPLATRTLVHEDNESSISQGGRSRYKLPKLKLTEFSGSPKEWLTFWSQFKGIHEDDSLSPEEKFQYLIQATVSESVARRVVCSFPPTGGNYGKAIDHLKSRFGKEKVLVEVYVRDLLKLVLTNTNGKQRLSLASLYDQLETQLRALETLGVTSEKYASMLYPLVESALPADVLVTWERIRNQRDQREGDTDDTDQLKELMNFLRGEVESSIRLTMAKRGITSDDDDDERDVPRKKFMADFHTVTTTDLLNNSTVVKCIFCGRLHLSQLCTGVEKLSLKQRYAKIREASKCFKCLIGNHLARNCNASIKCTLCNGKHYVILCNNEKRPLTEINACSMYTGVDVILQTLLVNVTGPIKTQAVRALIDSGSGRSYVTSSAIKNFGLKPTGKIELAHSLFGGHVTSIKKHSVYNVEVSNVDNTYRKLYQLIEVEKICGIIDPTLNGPWLTELATQGIRLSDELQKECPINMLFGANITSKLYTGNIYETKGGPVAFETRFGWTLMGITEEQSTSFENTVLLSHSMYISTASVHDLWNLDIIGIHDPLQEKSKAELEKSTMTHFKNNVKRLGDGRYEVSLPWIEGHQPVSVNREMAERRLHSSLSKLKKLNKLDSYQKVYDEWLRLGIIEEVTENVNQEVDVSYLPHHPVFNEKSSTTPIRPVFDASAKSKGSPSLNDCLERGQNLLNEIPALLILFRMNRYAAISDIKKAFLQISIALKDRDYLRFLWYKDGRIIVLRHCRVVFGISSSPFLLAATINHHLERVKNELQETAKLLKESLYVDNCVVSVNSNEKRDTFIRQSTEICAEAKFELRGWVWNRGGVIAGDVSGVGSPECGLETGSNTSQETSISVLGLLWNVSKDTLSLDMRKILNVGVNIVTKRTILAATHRVFDPIGFTAPAVIVPKMLLQEVCKKKLKWDDPVPADIKRKFLFWQNTLNMLAFLEIPRWTSCMEGTNKSLHIFTDASHKAYTATAFLKSDFGGEGFVQLLLAKARLATIRPMTTPRLELVACECGAKMANYLQQTIDMTNTELYLWSDSGNALSWIKRKENWQVFVFNRVKTIKQFTNPDDWRHIPGHLNPADLPSRGCSNKQLLESRWWEGPDWLKKDKQFWPKSAITCDEKIVMSEKRKVVVSHLVQELDSIRYFRYFSNIRKVIRMVAWMKRWKTYKRGQKHLGELSRHEENEAEKSLWRMIQNESFLNSEKVLRQLNAKKDNSGLWRVETKLLFRNDSEGFRRPILLPKDHVAVSRLVQKEHLDMQHCGTQTLRSTLRERFWIINARVITRKIVTGCKRCIRYAAKKMTAPEPPLPENRVRDATTFEVVGIDLGGPLYLLNDEKSWFVIFTCAVYRAVHLELVSSLSTPGFIQALRRFIARRGKPEVIYTDNGTNFVGTENLMKKLNWEEIVEQPEAKRIKWIFNPPSAPWWGGWWEKIVDMVKKLLRKRLGRDLLDYEDMITILCDCEQLLNLRPLTYLSEDPNELIPLTPMMFLNEAKSFDVVDLDKIESSAFGLKYLHRQEIRQELRQRFRKEYLSLLLNTNIRQTGYNKIKVGDVVIMELENKKRVDWPIARVVQTFPSKDGMIRSVKIRLVKNGKVSEIDRPIQRLYMLESSIDDVEPLVNEANNRPVEEEGTENNLVIVEREEDEPIKQKHVTRSGREVHKPERFGF